MKEVKKIAEELGLKAPKVKTMVEAISTLTEKISEWETLSDIVVTSIEQEEEMKQAKANRLSIKNTRLQAKDFISAKRKEVQEEMSEYTKEDKAWLKIWQFFEASADVCEKKLAVAEKFKEVYEAEQKELLRVKRRGTLSLVHDSPDDYPIEVMTDKAFEDLVESLTALKEKREREDKLCAERLEAIDDIIGYFNPALIGTIGKLSEEEFQEAFNVATVLKAKEEKEAADAQKLKETTFIKRTQELSAFHSKFSSMIGMNTSEEAYQSVLTKAKAYVEPAPIIKPAVKEVPTAPVSMAKVVAKPSVTTVSEKGDRQKLEIFLGSFTYSPIVPSTTEGEKVYKELAVKFKGYLKWAGAEIAKLK